MQDRPIPIPLTTRLDTVGHWLAPLGLRAILAWEFFESGREKLLGQNWFDQLAGQFPLPFSLLSANLNWTLATWLELLGAVALLLGLGTRFVAYALIVLTVVATYAVHWPTGGRASPSCGRATPSPTRDTATSSCRCCMCSCCCRCCCAVPAR
ncbi:DoxX family protein [Cupriavidus sp. H18C1]|uniref:HvfX family Cu-binding RiPP maturation protein n=1 Tax=Cupriavidus sp. H18C1 TaxID=3241601 RepID=UPI003BB9A723